MNQLSRLSEAFRFAEMLNQFRNVKRIVYANGSDRLENNSEHSYHLAMLAWFIVSTEKLSLDIDLVLKYALLHDLVEAYAGDTYAYTDDKKLRESKISREHEALVRLKREFPLGGEIFVLVDRYEKRADSESRFVYALDKIQPAIQIYLDDGRMWKEKNITLQMQFEYLKDKVALSPEIRPYFDELMALLKKKETALFA